MPLRQRLPFLACSLVGLLGMLLAGGCPPPEPDGDDGFLNTTDPTNNGASYVGAGACAVCHFETMTDHALHGHSQILNRVFRVPPVYPAGAERAGVPDPPDGFEWSDISYVIGGYLRAANFLDGQGYLLTDGTAGVNTQWNLAFPPAQTEAQWGSFQPDQPERRPYTFECFRCHTTGPSREGRILGLPGIEGSWAEPGVQCEACHGPGSRHIVDPPRDIYVNPSAEFCGQCHSRNDGGPVVAADGFILHEQQYSELLASPHANLRCVTCHRTHVSPNHEPAEALINVCQNCHPDRNMALHEGLVYRFGDYQETLRCQSCHMPFATVAATAAQIGPGRQGDVRTHLFRINAEPVGFAAMFTEDSSRLRPGPGGEVAVTVDFVCLRCHNGQGGAFQMTIQSAADVADAIHQIAQ